MHQSTESKKKKNPNKTSSNRCTTSNPMIAENQLRGYCILECEKGKLKLSFTLSPENPALIQEYHLTLE